MIRNLESIKKKGPPISIASTDKATAFQTVDRWSEGNALDDASLLFLSLSSAGTHET